MSFLTQIVVALNFNPDQVKQAYGIQAVLVPSGSVSQLLVFMNFRGHQQ